MSKLYKLVILALLLTGVLVFSSNATAATSLADCSKLMASFNAHDYTEEEFERFWVRMTEEGCLYKNPTLTTPGDIRTNSEYCVIYAEEHNPLLAATIAEYKKLRAKENKALNRLDKKVNPLLRKLNRLSQRADKRKIAIIKRIQKLVKNYRRSPETKAREARMLILPDQASIDVINAFALGCLENKGLENNLRFLEDNLFYQKVNNKFFFKSLSYKNYHLESKTIEAESQANTLYKAAKSLATVHMGNLPSLKKLKKEVRYDGLNPIHRATKNQALNGKEGILYITAYGKRKICVSQLILESEGVKYFLNSRLSMTRSPNSWVDKNMVRCSR